ncbi:unnamed protein product [Ambrosiozyma monospora]|uniref:Unnamed protein product n=1 Tax=Ambrosiozyma monospora TaxID=43982 RepID=A0A9W6YVM8_AMBMO|nr:unnamed protein product [Ambrosiozyma monospora]
MSNGDRFMDMVDKFLSDELSRGHWSAEDDRLLLQLAKLNKFRWNLIATHFNANKTPEDCEARYNVLTRS